MKAIIIAVMVVIVMMGLLQFKGGETITYIQESTMEVVPEEPKEAWMTDEDAIKAAQAVVRKKELETERGELQSQIDEMKKRVVEIDKELGTY
jgi:hypothetical protein